jgi:hypothetical protein
MFSVDCRVPRLPGWDCRLSGRPSVLSPNIWAKLAAGTPRHAVSIVTAARSRIIPDGLVIFRFFRKIASVGRHCAPPNSTQGVTRTNCKSRHLFPPFLPVGVIGFGPTLLSPFDPPLRPLADYVRVSSSGCLRCRGGQSSTGPLEFGKAAGGIRSLAAIIAGRGAANALTASIARIAANVRVSRGLQRTAMIRVAGSSSAASCLRPGIPRIRGARVQIRFPQIGRRIGNAGGPA